MFQSRLVPLGRLHLTSPKYRFKAQRLLTRGLGKRTIHLKQGYSTLRHTARMTAITALSTYRDQYLALRHDINTRKVDNKTFEASRAMAYKTLVGKIEREIKELVAQKNESPKYCASTLGRVQAALITVEDILKNYSKVMGDTSSRLAGIELKNMLGGIRQKLNKTVRDLNFYEGSVHLPGLSLEGMQDRVYAITKSFTECLSGAKAIFASNAAQEKGLLDDDVRMSQESAEFGKTILENMVSLIKQSNKMPHKVDKQVHCDDKNKQNEEQNVQVTDTSKSEIDRNVIQDETLKNLDVSKFITDPTLVTSEEIKHLQQPFKELKTLEDLPTVFSTLASARIEKTGKPVFDMKAIFKEILAILDKKNENIAMTHARNMESPDRILGSFEGFLNSQVRQNISVFDTLLNMPIDKATFAQVIVDGDELRKQQELKLLTKQEEGLQKEQVAQPKETSQQETLSKETLPKEEVSLVSGQEKVQIPQGNTVGTPKQVRSK